MPNIWIAIFLGGILNVTASSFVYAAPSGNAPPFRPSACGQRPPSGTTSVLDPIMLRPDIEHGIFSVKNERRDTIALLLTDVTGAHKYQVMVLEQSEAAQITVPSGRYGLVILNGQNWCNLDVGFTDGLQHQMTGGVNIQPNNNIRVTVGMSNEPGQIKVVYGKPPSPRPPQEQIVRSGVEIQRDQGGRYVTTGAINSMPVNFVIDTGASGVTLSSRTAQRIGILQCYSPSQYSTANGTVTGCNSIVPELTFGPFRLTNVTVSILPNMTSDALLGMAVLQKFSMVLQGDHLRLSLLGSSEPNPSPPALPPQLPTATLVNWPAPPILTQPSPQVIFAHDRTAMPRPPDRLISALRYASSHPAYLLTISAFLIFFFIRRQQRSQTKSADLMRLPNPRAPKGATYYNPKEFRSRNTNSD